MHRPCLCWAVLVFALGSAPIVPAAPVPPNTAGPDATLGTRLDQIPDWNTFFLEFRRAVQQRDRGALQSAMDDDFFYTFERAHKSDARKQAVRRWECEGDAAWMALEKVLRAGSRGDPAVRGLMVSPPAWVSDDRYTGYRAGFMKVGGHWRWLWFVSGDS